ncbi:hypothetical protein A9X04_12075 [Mycobacterium sp. E3247]|nr:hypothetical protein A9X04_12075 [Mycobacterium sp. E3247]
MVDGCLEIPHGTPAEMHLCLCGVELQQAGLMGLRSGGDLPPQLWPAASKVLEHLLNGTVSVPFRTEIPGLGTRSVTCQKPLAEQEIAAEAIQHMLPGAGRAR